MGLKINSFEPPSTKIMGLATIAEWKVKREIEVGISAAMGQKRTDIAQPARLPGIRVESADKPGSV
jgi:hypothetical protein